MNMFRMMFLTLILVLSAGCVTQEPNADVTNDAYYSGRLHEKKGAIFRTLDDFVASRLASGEWDLVASESDRFNEEKTSIRVPKASLIRFDGLDMDASPPSGYKVFVKGVYTDGAGDEYRIRLNNLCDWMPLEINQRCLGVNPDYLKEASIDGQIILPTNIGFDGPVTSVVSYDMGGKKTLVFGGFFRHAGGLRSNFIAAWDGNDWFSFGNGLNGGVTCLEVHNDGTGEALFAGGHFTSADNVVANRVAKWNGREWQSVGEGFSAADYSYVSSLKQYYSASEGRSLLIAGGLLHESTSQMHGIAKWDGQTWTPVGDGVDGKVSSLATFKSADSKSVLLAGGPFFRGRAIGNLDQDSDMITYLGSWDGTKWQPFGILKNFRPNTMIVLPSETTIVVGGADFDNNREVFLWSVNGTEWSAKLTLDSIPQDPTRVHRICSAIALHRFEDSLPSHDALVVGFQLSENATSAKSSVFRRTGDSWESLGEPFVQRGIYVAINSLASASIERSEQQVLIAVGDFERVGEIEVNNAAIWTGTKWSRLDFYSVQERTMSESDLDK